MYGRVHTTKFRSFWLIITTKKSRLNWDSMEYAKEKKKKATIRLFSNSKKEKKSVISVRVIISGMNYKILSPIKTNQIFVLISWLLTLFVWIWCILLFTRRIIWTRSIRTKLKNSIGYIGNKSCEAKKLEKEKNIHHFFFFIIFF